MSKIEQIWYGKSPWQLALLPVSWVFCLLVLLRRLLYRTGLINAQVVTVPVIVVGNITVGGTGKTPMVTWLVSHLRKQGYKPAIISRGYGGKANNWPQQVRRDSDPKIVGDEAVLLARRCHCPIAVGPDRVAAARALLQHTDCDIIISDDGLQHYRMQRDLEIAVIDGVRRYGNGLCLPAGPLREPPGRIDSVDMVVVNGVAGRGEFGMQLKPGKFVRVNQPHITTELADFAGKRVHAVAGIGNPKRFFDQLRSFGLEVVEHPLPDHHPFQKQDLYFDDDLAVIMTEKDAVKCQHLVDERHWMMPVTAHLDEVFVHRFNHLLKRIGNG